MVYCLLCIIIFFLCIKIYLIKKAAREIAVGFADKLSTDTNTLITISSHDKDMQQLAAAINTQLRILRREHQRYTLGDSELKTAITNISHDLRTPLTAICGYLDVLKREPKSEKIENYLSIVSERTEAMKQLTEELFKYSIILSSDEMDSMEDTLVNQVLEDSIMGYYAALTEKGIIPSIQMTENRIIRKVNKQSLSRVFSNLLNNAIKYSDGDLEIILSDSGLICFSNRAAELTTVQVEHLFDRFYTVETGRNSTGLGLSIARKLVEQMGGTISAKQSNSRLIISVQL